MAKQIIAKSNWQKIRKLFNDIHLWLGLSSGLIVIAICFSGTVYVYNTEFTERAAPHLYKVKPLKGQQRIPVDSLLERIRTNTGGTITSITVPADLARTYQFNIKTKTDSTNRGGTTYMVNPYTGDIVGNSKEKNGTKEFMSTMFSLHRWLLLDRIKSPIIKGKTNRELGSIITGTATMIFTLGCITGLIIWFPHKVRNWKQGLKIKWNAGWKRINHDLHNSLAIYALFFLLLMGLTGPQFSFEWYRKGLQKTLGTYKTKDAPKEKPPRSKIPTDTMSLSLSVADYIKATDSVLAYKGNYSILMPADPSATVTITKTKTGFFAPAAGDRITLDQYSGNPLKVDIFKDRPFNERVAGSIKAIHVGNVYGGFTKILYFLACLIATSLPITGTMVWLNKLKKRRRSGKSVMPEMVMA